MKKLLIIALLFVLPVSAQQNFSGTWVSERSSYYNNIISDSNNIIRVINISFLEKRVVEEAVLYHKNNSFTTVLNSKEDSYCVEIAYTLNSEDTMTCVYTGDYTGVVKLRKITEYELNN